MILHALYENGGLAPSDIESHIKDDIEKEGVKLVDMDKKMSQAYKDIVSFPCYPSLLRCLSSPNFTPPFTHPFFRALLPVPHLGLLLPSVDYFLLSSDPCPLLSRCYKLSSFLPLSIVSTTPSTSLHFSPAPVKRTNI